MHFCVLCGSEKPTIIFLCSIYCNRGEMCLLRGTDCVFKYLYHSVWVKTWKGCHLVGFAFLIVFIFLIVVYLLSIQLAIHRSDCLCLMHVRKSTRCIDNTCLSIFFLSFVVNFVLSHLSIAHPWMWLPICLWCTYVDNIRLFISNIRLSFFLYLYWCGIHLWFRLMGGLQAKSMTSQRYRAVTRWRMCVTMATLWQQQDGGYALLWKRYDNNKMVAMRYYGNVMTTTRWWQCVTILHLQQYSHRLNLFFPPLFL